MSKYTKSLMDLIYVSSLELLEENKQNQYVLRHHKIFLIVGLILLFLCVLFGCILYINLFHHIDRDVMELIVFLFGISGLGIIMMYANFRVILTPNKIIYKNILSFKKEINWCDIVDVSFDGLEKQLIITTENKQIKISMVLKGFYTLLWMMNQTIDEHLYKKALLRIYHFYHLHGIQGI